MANQETQKLDNMIASRRAMLVGGGAALAALAMAPKKAEAVLTPTSYTDFDILNFALNLEYLEANFYYMAAFGCTIDKPNAAAIAAGAPSAGIGIGSGTTTTGTTATYGTATAVPFTLPAVKAYAIETAIEEGKHVLFLRNAIQSFGGTNVAQPALDISPAGAFTTLATAAGLAAAGAPLVTNGQFNPYANDVAFLAGAYVFEDVGVTAYHGAAPLISQTSTGKIILQAAAGILAVEAYHSGLIRTTIYNADPMNAAGYLSATQKVSQLRATLGHAFPASTPSSVTAMEYPDDFGLYPGTYPQAGTTNPPATGTVTVGSSAGLSASNIADVDPTTCIAFGRTTSQVLNIVTGGGGTTSGAKATGVFFPSGMNGTFA